MCLVVWYGTTTLIQVYIELLIYWRDILSVIAHLGPSTEQLCSMNSVIIVVALREAIDSKTETVKWNILIILYG